MTLRGWKTDAVGNLCTRISVGIVVKPSQYYIDDRKGVRAFRSANVGLGKIIDRDWVYISEEGHKANAKSQLKIGDVLVVRTGAPGTACVLTKEYEGSNCIDIVFARPDQTKMVPEYLAALTNSNVGRRHVGSNTSGLAQKHFNVGAFKELVVNYPPLSEQRRIAQILRTWDDAIEKLEALRAAKEKRRKGILQVLLGIDRPFSTHWEIKSLDEIVERIRRTNDGGDHPVMTISAKSGFLMQSDKFARDMAGSSVDRYTLLHRGEFAYNKGNSKTAPYGCIFPLDRPSAVIPFVYFCFKLDESLHHPFYVHLFAAGALHHQLSRLINSGVRNDGLLNLYADDFFSCEVPVPPIEEQQRIATAITAANDEIALLDDEIEALKRQKRGLMQKLLTGEWRVSISSDGDNVQ